MQIQRTTTLNKASRSRSELIFKGRGMTDRQFIDALIKKTILSDELGQKLLIEAGQSGKSVEDIIYARRLVDEISVAKTKGELLGAPYKKVNPDEIKENVLKTIAGETAQAYGFVPLERDNKMLVAGMLRPNQSQVHPEIGYDFAPV